MENVQLAINSLFIVGVLANLLKAADLLLRPHQQQRLQAALEDLTLRLEYVRPLEWYPKLVSDTGRRWLIVAWKIQLLLVATWVFIQQSREVPFGTSVQGASGVPAPLSLAGPSLKVAQVVFLVAALYFFPKLFKRWIEPLLSWLLRDEHPWRFVGRLALYTLSMFLGFQVISMVTLLATISLGTIFVWLGSPELALADALEAAFSNQAVFLVFGTASMVLIAPVFFLVAVVWQVGMMVFWSLVCIAIVDIVLRLIRGASWRVVEYSKGPVAAMVLVITVVLGILSLYLSELP